MSKELRAFRKICRNMSSSYEFTDEYKKNKKLIETALKEKETQDIALITLKEVIKFDAKLQDIEPSKDTYDIAGTVAIQIQREIENAERNLLREWVLKTCFPKELEAIKILREIDKIPLLHLVAICVKDPKKYELVKEALL